MTAVAQAARQHRDCGGALLGRGLLVAAGEEFSRWLALVDGSGDPNMILPPLNALCTVSQIRLDHEGALAWLDRSLPYLADRRVDPFHIAKTRINRLISLAKLNRDEEALQEAAVVAEVLGNIGSPYLTGLMNLNLISVHAKRQEWVQARRAAQVALEQFRIAGDQQAMADALVNLGIAHLELGVLRLARRDLTRALKLYGDGGGATAYVYTELGRLAQMEGDLDRAVEYGAQALDRLLNDVAVLDKEEVAKVSELFGGLFAETGERNLALKYLNRAAAYFSQLGRLAEWQRVTGRIGQVLVARARPGTAPLGQAVQRLDFLTALLDLTDDIESVDPYLRGHSERVARLAVLLGQAAGLAAPQLKVLNYAGRLHDVGKVAVDADILRKPGKLTPAEWERVRVHPVIGEEMLRPYGLDPAGLRAVRHHHEHWDGGGYPDGLKGEAIPLLARILTVADVYDAVTSDRVYRRAMSHSDALVLMRHMSGSQLDPNLVDLFFKMHEV